MGSRRLQRRVEARYLGQNFEISIDLDDGGMPEIERFLQDFSAAHIREYGYDANSGVVELVNCRVRAVGSVTRAPWKKIDGSTRQGESAKKGERNVYFEETGWQETPVYHRPRLPINTSMEGPAIIDEMSSTIVVLPGQSFIVDDFGNLIVSI